MEYVAVLLPSLVVGLLFWFAMKSIFNADKAERQAEARAQAEADARARASDPPGFTARRPPGISAGRPFGPPSRIRQIAGTFLLAGSPRNQSVF
jgi:hypothetical protein